MCQNKTRTKEKLRVCAGRWVVAGGGCSGHLTNACTRPPPLPPLPKSPRRLIKLDQDDTNNWLKLGPVRSPNDPYLTPFVAMVSLFLHCASIWNGLPWLHHKRFSPVPCRTQNSLTSWERRKGYIFRRCLGNRQRAGFVTVHPFGSRSPEGDTGREEDEVLWCETFSIWYRCSRPQGEVWEIQERI